MSFENTEISDEDGRPIYLYEFRLGPSRWRYTSSDADVIMSGYRWVATAISNESLTLSGEAVTDTLTVTCPSDLAPAQLMIGTPPSASIMLSIYHYHETDTNMVLAYVGELLQVNFSQPGMVQMTIDTLSVSLQRDGLRLGWQRSCPHALYDKQCLAPKVDHTFEAVITGIVTNVVTVTGIDGQVDDAFSGGYIEWQHPQRGVEYRGVESHKGAELTMFGFADGLYSGLKIKVLHGCDRTAATCASKFNNLDNYGGVPDMPGKSPFDGDPVF